MAEEEPPSDGMVQWLARIAVLFVAVAAAIGIVLFALLLLFGNVSATLF